MPRLLSNKALTATPEEVHPDRYEFLDLSQAEPNLGVAPADNFTLHYDSTAPGNRKWKVPAGFTGSQGIQGAQGTQGTQGGQGTQGIQGGQGRQGIQGIQGPPGFTGSQGIQGTTGTQGAQGLLGNQGTQGSTGADSTVPGPTGPPGPTGAASTVPGPTGPAGGISLGDPGSGTAVVYDIGGETFRLALDPPNAASAGDFIATSDRRLKTNIVSLESALDRTLQINGVTFDWKNPDHSNIGQVGVIAQDVQSVLPQAVYTTPDGSLAVSYGKIVPLLIEAVRELKAEVDKLKHR